MRWVMKRFFKILLLVILILGIGGCIASRLAVNSLLDKMEHEEVIPEQEAEIAPEVIETVKERNIVNIALFGADNSQGPAGTDEDRSDAMKIVSLDFDNKKIKITSVERDVVVWMPGERQEYGHFNWAYWFGGPTLAVQTLNYNLDLDITQYVTFSFNAVEKLIDLLGGVDVNLTSAEISKMGNRNLKPGMNTLSGYDAMAYCRIRKIDSDFVRMERQNNVIQAVAQKMKNMSLPELAELVSKMLPSITTNLTNDEIMSYMTSLIQFDLTNIETYREPSGEYNDIMTCPRMGGYLVRSYSDMVSHLHYNIYGDNDYKPSQTVLDNEKRTYETFGEFTKE